MYNEDVAEMRDSLYTWYSPIKSFGIIDWGNIDVNVSIVFISEFISLAPLEFDSTSCQI